jgi:hypothetical protein
MLALGELFPSLVPVVLRSMGVLKAMQARASNEAPSLEGGAKGEEPRS